MPVRVLVVCSGNICRSPTAEAVLRHLASEAGLGDEVIVASAGTGDWHAGESADPRSVAAARRRGYTIDGVARQVTGSDFEDYDVIAAVDDDNLDRLVEIAPPGAASRLRRLGPADLPDPYYGGPSGFDDVLDLVEQYCTALLDELRGGRGSHPES